MKHQGNEGIRMFPEIQHHPQMEIQQSHQHQCHNLASTALYNLFYRHTAHADSAYALTLKFYWSHSAVEYENGA